MAPRVGEAEGLRVAPRLIATALAVEGGVIELEPEPAHLPCPTGAALPGGNVLWRSQAVAVKAASSRLFHPMCQRAGSSSSCQSISCSCRVLISCITTSPDAPGHRAGRPPPGRTIGQLALAIPGPLGKQQGVGRKVFISSHPPALTVTHRSTGNHHIQITASSTALVQMPQGKFTAPWRPRRHRRRPPPCRTAPASAARGQPAGRPWERVRAKPHQSSNSQSGKPDGK